MTKAKRDKTLSTKETISFRVSPYEKWLYEHVADQLDTSVSNLARQCTINWVSHHLTDVYREVVEQHRKMHENNDLSSNR